MPRAPAARLREALVAAAAYAAPLLWAPFPPGQDTPMHAVAVASRDFLGYLEPNAGVTSYVVLYALAHPLAAVAGPTAALSVISALYVLAFAWAARRLVASFGGHPGLALLAVPAAYSVVFAYGFVPFAIGYPLVMWQWAALRGALRSGLTRRRLLELAAASLLLGLTHPLAAAIGAGGAVALVIAHATRATFGRTAAAVSLLAAGLVPAGVALAQIAARAPAVALPPLMRDASLWDRLWSSPRTPLPEALARAPSWLLGGFAPGARVPLALGLVAAALAALWLGGRRPREGATGRERHAAELLLLALLGAYLLAPWQLDEPFVIAVQPRLLPLVWVAALCALPLAPMPRRPRATAAPLVAAATLGASLWFASTWPVAREGRDLASVIDAAAPRAMTLALIEQPPAGDTEPAGPWRHAGVYLMARRGGYASHAFFDRGSWLPVRRAAGPTPPAAPLPGNPRGFSCARHLAGWDQLLIRDADAAAPHDYAAGCPDRLERVVAAGRWRLYRVRSAAARSRSDAAGPGSP